MTKLFLRVVSIGLLLIASMIVPAWTHQSQMTGIFGGPGGDQFADSQIPSGARLLGIRIKAVDRIDSIQVMYTTSAGKLLLGARFGGGGGRLSIFRLQSGEHITAISGRYDDGIDSLRIHTNKRVSPSYGGAGGDHFFRIEVPQNSRLIGFTGRSGDFLDAIGLVYESGGVPNRPLWKKIFSW